MLKTSTWIYEDLAQGLNTFNTMAYNGRFFFFASGRNVYVYSKDFVPVKCIKVAPNIATFCYDNKDDCFWAAEEKTGEIVKLNRRFKEVARLPVNFSAVYGLSYFCAHDTLLICTRDRVLEACKHGEKREIQTISKGANIASAAPFFAVYDGQVIHFYSPENIHSTLEVPAGYTIKDMLFYPPENQILALAQFNNRVKILRHPMPCIDICDCNYNFNDFCDEHCKWLMAEKSCDSGWGSVH